LRGNGFLIGGTRRLIRKRTQLANAIRGHAAEFGLTAAKGMAHLVPLLDRIEADESLPALARELFAIQAEECTQLQTPIDEIDTRFMAWHRADAIPPCGTLRCSQWLSMRPLYCCVDT
jgi:transposase